MPTVALEAKCKVLQGLYYQHREASKKQNMINSPWEIKKVRTPLTYFFLPFVQVPPSSKVKVLLRVESGKKFLSR